MSRIDSTAETIETNRPNAGQNATTSLGQTRHWLRPRPSNDRRGIRLASFAADALFVTCLFAAAPAAAGVSAQQSCTVELSVTSAQNWSTVSVVLDYADTTAEFIQNQAGHADCWPGPPGAVSAANDDRSNRNVSIAVVALGSVSSPAAFASCNILSSGVPAPGDFAVEVIEASGSDNLPVTPLPDVEVTSIDCAPVFSSTTTTMVPTSTTLVSTTTIQFPGECEVALRLEDDVVLGAFGVDINYSASGGYPGSRNNSVDCTAEAVGLMAVEDDIPGETLSTAMISLSGIPGPGPVLRCRFVQLPGIPSPGDFQLTLRDSADIYTQPVDPAPTFSIDTSDCNAGGDGVVSGTEECEPGPASPSCNPDCSLAVCGNGTTEAEEECDDPGDPTSCNADCTVAVCGNNRTEPAAGEVCDEGTETATCDNDCTLAVCGEGFRNRAAREECDPGTETASCDSDCTLVFCGDSHINTLAGEICDDGNADYETGELCSSTCQRVQCGQPLSIGGGPPTTSDSLFVLLSAIGAENCHGGVCDVDASGAVMTTDSLQVLLGAVGHPVEFECPEP